MTTAEKMEVIRLVEGSSLSVKRTLAELEVPRSTFYRWYRAYTRSGYVGLEPRDRDDRRHWNRIPEQERACGASGSEQIVGFHFMERTSRECQYGSHQLFDPARTIHYDRPEA